MEVIPDVYAWLVSLEILDGTKSVKIKNNGKE